MFLALHKISNLDRNMISIFCLWLFSRSFLAGFLDLLSHEVCGCSHDFLKRGAGGNILRTSPHCFQEPLLSHESNTYFLLVNIVCACVTFYITDLVLKKSVFYLWILSLLLITSRWSMSPSLLGQLFAPLGLRPIGLTGSTGLTELTGTGTRLLKRF